MLKLVNIKKDYVSKGIPTVHALKGLTINFRRNEFVAILGASGCGKTTLLNIIGGLDRYTSGDLVIEGKSTKDYTDRDWDTYRNHSIGFIFQSYNLISHQSILSNVELALTISGVSKEERKRRAIEALKTVGLEGMEKKKPNQLSGGQMQRVAIARALVNDPEILLADEPTGALDSETSVQIMDLLKEVASDRLVIMVTHNPDLANEYANRIVTMKDGVITGDANPYEGEPEQDRKVAIEKKTVNKGNKTRTSMSFFTATGLSFFNLLSKIKRTVLITIAGSIGIIGVSAVLAVRQGVTNYVDGMQDDMLSQYPLSIAETSVDYSALMSGLASMNQKELSKFDLTTEVGLDSMIQYLMEKYNDFTKVKTNDINDDLIEFVETMPNRDKYVASIYKDYGLDLTNNIFTKWQRDEESATKYMSLNGLTQMYISELKTVDGFAEYTMFVDLFTDFMQQIPGDKEYILSQYELLGENSKYAENANEIMLVVDDNQTLTDFTYAQMGFYNEKEFLNIARKAVKTQQINSDDSLSQAQKEAKLKELDELYVYPTKYKIDDIIGKELVYCAHDDMYAYDELENDICTIDEVMVNLYDQTDTQGWPIKSQFVYNQYTETLEGSLTIQDTAIPTSLLSVNRNPEGPSDANNPFVGWWDVSVASAGLTFRFVLESDYSTDVKMFNPDANAWVSVLMPTSPRQYSKSTEVTHAGYMYNATPDLSKCETVKIAGILKKKKDVQFGCLDRGVYYTSDMTSKYMLDGAFSEIVNDMTHGIKTHLNSESKSSEIYNAYVTYTYTSFKNGDDHPIYDVPGIAMALNTDFSSSLSSLFSITGGTTSAADINKAYLRSLCGYAAKLTGMATYEFDDLPRAIAIYPKNFSSKKQITKYLDTWNKEGPLTLTSGRVLQKEDRQELTYTDTIELIINVINTLITTITVALIAFTSLSLIVSCFMIAVITYISTMERVKEIGVIRSLGGRKRDVSRLFIAECLIIGLASGVFGIGTTYLMALIFNISINVAFGIGNMAILTIPTALIMIGVSILLNVLSGLIPAIKAASQDPVVALRTE